MRVIAILMVVVGHTANYIEMGEPDTLSAFVINLLTGETAYFVFVSGYMFHHVFHDRYQYKTFMTGKLRTVTSPYLFISIPLIIWTIVRNPFVAERLFSNPSLGAPFGAMETGIKFIATGAVLSPFWYIPFIMLTFVVSPLHGSFMRSSTGMQVALIVSFFLIAVLCQRPLDNLNAFHSLVFFTLSSPTLVVPTEG